MRLYLLRHGTAEPLTLARDDRSRALVDKGRAQARLAADCLRRLEVRPARVVSSPYPRALDTALEVVRTLGLPVEVGPLDELRPGSDPERAIAAVLEGARAGEPVLAAGHEPLLSTMAARLCGAPMLRLELRKGGLVELELQSLDPPEGVLLGLLRPGHLG